MYLYNCTFICTLLDNKPLCVITSTTSFNEVDSSSGKESHDESHTNEATPPTKMKSDKVPEEDNLDKRLAMLKAELTNGDTNNNYDDDNNCPDTVFNDDEFTTLPSVESVDCNKDTIDDELFNEEDDFFDDEVLVSLKELPNSKQGEDKGSQEHQSPEQEEIITFKGLVKCQCEPHFGDNAAFNKLNKEYSGIFFEGAVKLIRSGIGMFYQSPFKFFSLMHFFFFFLEKMMDSFCTNYPQLAAIEENVDECRNVIEAVFFPPIIPLLLLVYR